MRRRGLKLSLYASHQQAQEVASRAEAWIETTVGSDQVQQHAVASRAEAWIETILRNQGPLLLGVASRAEAWIETFDEIDGSAVGGRRLPCGGVD